MALDNLPVFTFRPNWNDQVTETLEWKTAVLQAQRQGSNGTAAEQRRMLRLSPRRSLDLDLVLIGADRTYFDLLIHAAGASDFYVPVFHNVDVLATDVAATATSIPLPAGGYNELPAWPGGACVLLGEDPHTYEIFEGWYDGATLHVITVGGLANDWPRKSRVFPLMRAKLAAQPNFTEVSSKVRTSAVRFTSVGPQDWTSTGQEGFDSWQGYPVLVREPNWSNGLDGIFLRTINTTDNDSGLWDYTDVSGRGFGTQTHTWFCLTRKDHAAIRDMLYLLRGQLLGFWMPTFGNDIEFAEFPLADDTSITIKKIGYADLGFPVEGRDTICVFTEDGYRLFAKIVSAVSADAETEVLSLEAGLGLNLDAGRVRKVSFMQYSRLAQDAIEIAHLTDNKGVSTISATVSAISYDRDGPDWTPPALVNPTMLTDGCGFVPAIFLTTSGPDHDPCVPGITTPYGFSWLEKDEDPPGEDHIAYIHMAYGSNADWTIRWAFARSTFTILYGFDRNVTTLMNQRTSDRAGNPFSIDWDLLIFNDTNAICGNSVQTMIRGVLGNEVVEQGCSNPPGWVPAGNEIGVKVGVNKAGIGVGATNIDYDFGVTIYAGGSTHNLSFPSHGDAEGETLPIAGTSFNFHVSIRCDGAGSARFIITSAYHGTALDETYSAPETVSLFNFCPVNELSSGGRASNADLDVLENVISFSGFTVQA